jgi:hypothetical protein
MTTRLSLKFGTLSGSMNLPRNSVIAALVALVIVLSLATPAFAQSSNWVTVTSVQDLTGNATLQAGQPLLAGHAYNMTIKVAVPFNQTNSRFQVSLNGFLLSQGAQFWYVKSPHYAGYDPSNFTAGLRGVSFKQVQGDLALSGVFQIPVNLTLQKAGSLTLHFPLVDFPVISVTVTGGAAVGNVTMTVQDETIRTYLTTYQQKATLISTGQIDSSYSQFVNGVLNMSQTLYAMGFADRATTLLNILTPSAFPAPPNPTFFNGLLIGVVVLAILVVLLLVLMVRGRGKSQYSSSIANEIQKELATLEVTASKYDKNLADRLKALRDKLSETS